MIVFTYVVRCMNKIERQWVLFTWKSVGYNSAATSHETEIQLKSVFFSFMQTHLVAFSHLSYRMLPNDKTDLVCFEFL